MDKHNEFTKQGNTSNPKVLVTYTSNGKIVRPNPAYDPNKCGKCNGHKGLFHNCKGGK